jgi:deoxyhypusine synthase
MEKKRNAISSFIKKYYLHFNAAAPVDATKSYKAHPDAGGKMMITAFRQ